MDASKASTNEDNLDQKVQVNIMRWQAVDGPLAPLLDEQKDLLYQIEDVMKYTYNENEPQDDAALETTKDEPIISTYGDYVAWLVKVENEAKGEEVNDYLLHAEKLKKQSRECEALFEATEEVIGALGELDAQYEQVTSKTGSLHVLSEELMRHQNRLKEKKRSIGEKLRCFASYPALYDRVTAQANNVNGDDFRNTLDQIDDALAYLNEHRNFKDSYGYRIKYENLLVIALQNVLKSVTQVINDAVGQAPGGLGAQTLLSVDVRHGPELNVETAFSYYYGKFQNAANKVSAITGHIEEKIDVNEMYKRTLVDSQKAYFARRSPVMTAAVSKGLLDLRDRHRTDHSVLFRSSSLFMIKVCQDESACFRYFFARSSPQLDEYLAALCQNLYDVLRPSLIGINHLEVLTEICTILKETLIGDQVLNNAALDQFVRTVRQLVEDVEERLVFRANVFFQHDLLKYEPSPGDLAYPEKLEQMENIAEEMSERRVDSRASSMESQEVANNFAGQFRSYTGNSPADLHGMWYPTVKRTLVCLSRLYLCLDREIFQGLAQEALIICIKTIDGAAEKISTRKSSLDGHLFHIKHLLIIREQIAPFQVDFTVKEMGLDFSNVREAAVGLLQKRNRLFSLSSNNALLEFLLEGTPRVKEYLVDSRKEIDKQLKAACEAFIANATHLLVGDVLRWVQKAEQAVRAIKANEQKTVSLREQEFARPRSVAALVGDAQRNIKAKIPDVQKSMRLYLANRETEFILFRPVKNNVLNAYIQVEQILNGAGYTRDDQLMIACPSTEQVNVLICSVSLTAAEQELGTSSRNLQSRHSDVSANQFN